MQVNKAFAELLNAAPATADHWRAILPAHEQGLLLGGLPQHLWSFSPPQSSEAQNLFRQYIGEWIASGFQPDGSEVPEKRTYVTWGGQAIFQSLEGLLNSFHVIEGPREQTIFGLQANNSKQKPLRGSLRFMFEPRGGILASPVVFRRHLKPEELAAMGFLYFWNSGQLFTIMRCANCGVFALPRKVRKSYLRGWHCEQCRNSASAKAATEAYRKNSRARWFPRAVAAFREYESSPRLAKTDRVLFIRDRVNEKLPAYRHIKRNTITHNLSKIQAAAEGRTQNAES